jgi:hypothetical protein
LQKKRKGEEKKKKKKRRTAQNHMDNSASSLSLVSPVSGAWLLVAKGDLYRRYGQAGCVVSDKGERGTRTSLFFFGGCSDDGQFSRDLVCHEFEGHTARVVEDTTPLEDRPFARHFHSCVFYGGFVFVFAGKSNGYHNDLWQYHIYQNNWKMVKPISGQSKLFARFGQSAVLWQGALYVFGGYDQHGFCCDGLHAFQFARNAWFKELKTTGKARERYHHSAVVYGRSMFIFGGRSDNDALEDLLEYHFDARSWSLLTTTGTPPSKRWGHSAAVIGDRMFVFGGCDGSSCFGDLYEYEFGTRRWGLVDVPHCPSPRYFHMMCVDGEKMYIVGGKDLWGRCLRADHELLTSEGFMGLAQLTQRWDRRDRCFSGDLKIATYDKAGKLVYQPASRLVVNPFERQTLLSFSHGSGAADLVVTAEHDMFVDGCKVRAKNLLGKSVWMKMFARDGKGGGGEQPGFDEEALFAFGETFNCWNCVLPSFLWHLNSSLLRCFFVGLLRGGSVVETRVQKTCDDLVWLAMEAGLSAWFERVRGDLFRVRFSAEEDLLFDAPVETLYEGVTWCVTVPNGLVFARRKSENGWDIGFFFFLLLLFFFFFFFLFCRGWLCCCDWKLF